MYYATLTPSPYITPCHISSHLILSLFYPPVARRWLRQFPSRGVYIYMYVRTCAVSNVQCPMSSVQRTRRAVLARQWVSPRCVTFILRYVALCCTGPQCDDHTKLCDYSRLHITTTTQIQRQGNRQLYIYSRMASCCHSALHCAALQY